MLQQDYKHAHEYFQQAVYRSPQSPQIWISVATLYYRIQQYVDSLDTLSRAIRLNANFYLQWYNLGVLVRDIIHAFHFQMLIENKQFDANNQVEDAYVAFRRCLELNPHLPDVQARCDVLVGRRNDEKNVPDDHKIKNMLRCDLMAMVDQSDNMGGAEIVLNPIIDAENSK